MLRTFRKHFEEKMTDPDFREAYGVEKKRIDIAIKVAEAREAAGLSQIQLAEKARITQQQLSKIENGVNCNMNTFLKVCEALDLHLHVQTAQ